VQKHVLFDLDGTLTDPREGITRSYAHALATLGRPVPPLSELEHYIGPPTREVIGDMLQTTDPALIERAVAIYRERFGTVGLFENAPYAGIAEVLTELEARGYGLYVCTSKPTVYAERIAQHFGFTQLRVVYGCELDGTLADKRDLLAHILQREPIEPAHAVLIGDRLHDVRAAISCGLHSIGVLYGFGSRAELTEAGAERICATVSELLPAIEDLL
jgi:phosphoglycolate phosphatase